MNGAPIFLINCERDKERLNAADKELRSQGLDYQLLVATDKYKLTEQQLQQYSKFQALLSSARELSTGEIACAHSHYRAWEKVANGKAPVALILEDDVKISPLLTDALKIATDHTQQFDILLFRTDRRASEMNIPMPAPFKLVSYRKRPNRACAYVLTQSAAKKLLAYRFPIRMPLDDLLGAFRIHGLRIRGLKPYPVDIASVSSSIWEKSAMPQRSRKLRKLRSFLRLFTRYY